MLQDGCKITIGGTKKLFMEGCRMPSNAGPHLIFEYRAVRLETPYNVYRDPFFSQTDLLVVEEFENGRVVKETYHLEDFNETSVVILLFGVLIFFIIYDNLHTYM